MSGNISLDAGARHAELGNREGGAMTRLGALHMDAETHVRSAYQWILGREADESGLHDYLAAIHDGGMDLGALRAHMFSGEEFKRLHGQQCVAVDIGNGLKAVVNPREPEFGRHIARDGGWEPHIVAAIRDSLSPGETFVDIGANLGLMSFNAAQVVGEDGKVIAFEPDPTNVAYYRRGILANGFENILLYPFAVSDKGRMLALSTASNAKVQAETDAIRSGSVVQAVPADQFLIGEDRVDLIKMDIEGYELMALHGLEHTLCKFKPNVLLEFNPLCLREQAGTDPAVLAEHIFGMTRSVQIVEHDRSRTEVRSPAALMGLLEERDQDATASGRLPPGWVHVDLLFRCV